MFIFLLTTNSRSDIIMMSKERTSVRKGDPAIRNKQHDRNADTGNKLKGYKKRGLEMKHLHIVIRFRFTMFVAAVILTIGTIIGLIAGSFNASGTTRTTYEVITVQSGDTLWSIAEQYVPEDKDIRDYIYEICDKNNIKAGDIMQGQDLMIPVVETIE